jgi:spermidine synthase
VEYVRHALVGLAYHGDPRRVLMVGLGGGAFSTLVHRGLPDATVDVVEIDPVVVAAARAHFGVREDGRYHVHVADAADWIGRDRGRYDFVLLDAYAGEGIPPPLGTEAFFRAVARRLAPGGVVAINIAEMGAEGRAVARAFTAVLATFDCRQTPVDGNVLLFAADGPLVRDAGATRRWLSDWDARGVTNFSLAALAARPARGPECESLGSAAPSRLPSGAATGSGPS